MLDTCRDLLQSWSEAKAEHILNLQFNYHRYYTIYWEFRHKKLLELKLWMLSKISTYKCFRQIYDFLALKGSKLYFLRGGQVSWEIWPGDDAKFFERGKISRDTGTENSCSFFARLDVLPFRLGNISWSRFSHVSVLSSVNWATFSVQLNVIYQCCFMQYWQLDWNIS